MASYTSQSLATAAMGVKPAAAFGRNVKMHGAVADLGHWNMVGRIRQVRSAKRHLKARPTVDIRRTHAVLKACPTLPVPHLQSLLVEGGGRYIGGLIKPEHTGLRLTCHRDSTDGLGVAPFDGAFDPIRTLVCDVLHMTSLMVSSFTAGLALRVGPFPFPDLSCVRGRGEVHGSIGFKFETCMDDSMGAAQIWVRSSSPCPGIMDLPRVAFRTVVPWSSSCPAEFASRRIDVGAEYRSQEGWRARWSTHARSPPPEERMVSCWLRG
jgi:hypothetical protein